MASAERGETFNITKLFCEFAADQKGHNLEVEDSENFITVGYCWASGERRAISLEKSGSTLTGRTRVICCSGCLKEPWGIGGFLGPFGDAFYFKKK